MNKTTVNEIRAALHDNNVPEEMAEKAIARANALPPTGDVDVDVQRIATAISACIHEELTAMKTATEASRRDTTEKEQRLEALYAGLQALEDLDADGIVH